jgi:hypothetical protein
MEETGTTSLASYQETKGVVPVKRALMVGEPSNLAVKQKRTFAR